MNSMLRRLRGRLQHASALAEERLGGVRAFEGMLVPPEPVVTVTSDDGSARNLDVAEVLNTVGVKGVFAVSPDLLGRPGMLTLAHLGELRDAGHEIAFHGTSDVPFTSHRSTASLLGDLQRGLQYLRDNGFGPDVVMYPSGQHNRSIRSAVATVFAAGFSTWFGVNRDVANRYAIRRIPFGAYARSATESRYRQLLGDTASCGGWAVLMLHPGAEGHTAAHDRMLGRIVRQAVESSVHVRTAHTQLAAPAAPRQVLVG